MNRHQSHKDICLKIAFLDVFSTPLGPTQTKPVRLVRSAGGGGKAAVTSASKMQARSSIGERQRMAIR